MACRALRAGRSRRSTWRVGDVVTGTKTTADGTTAAQTDATAAFGIVQLTSYDLAVSVSEADIGDVKVGQVATVTVSATGEQLAARVLEVGVVVRLHDRREDRRRATSSSAPSPIPSHCGSRRPARDQAGHDRERGHRDRRSPPG